MLHLIRMMFSKLSKYLKNTNNKILSLSLCCTGSFLLTIAIRNFISLGVKTSLMGDEFLQHWWSLEDFWNHGCGRPERIPFLSPSTTQPEGIGPSCSASLNNNLSKTPLFRGKSWQDGYSDICKLVQALSPSLPLWGAQGCDASKTRVPQGGFCACL